LSRPNASANDWRRGEKKRGRESILFSTLICALKYDLYTIAAARGADTNAWDVHGAAPGSNPMIDALYCTLLHAMGRPRETFNLAGSSRDDPRKYRALPELLM
jgi:hypothetical protein